MLIDDFSSFDKSKFNIDLLMQLEENLQEAYEKRSELLKDTVIKQMNNSRVTAPCLLNTRVLSRIQVVYYRVNLSFSSSFIHSLFLFERDSWIGLMRAYNLCRA